MSKVALITGITGQDGSYLAKLLLENGYTVYGVTRDRFDLNDRNLRYLEIANDIVLIELPLLDRERIAKILARIRPDEIYNLSSQSSVGHSFSDPYNTLHYNVLSVLYWLEAIKRSNYPTKYYQASSSEMFGNVRNSDLPLKESLIFHPASPYGISKAAAHWLTINYRESQDIFSACGILFNHESALRGDRFVVKKIINTAVKITLGLYSGKLKLGNVLIQRDWGYAPEYVKAMWLMLQQDKPGDFLICSGNVLSLENLIDIVFNLLGIDRSEYVQQDASLLRPNDLEIIYGDNSKAKHELGWEYEMSNEDLISRLIEDELRLVEWEQNQKH